MIQIESSTQIDRPRNEVFEAITDVGSLPKWQSGVIASKPISTGELRVGYQFEETVRMPMAKMRMECTVTELKPHERFAFIARSRGPLDCDARFELQPIAGGTRLTFNGTAYPKGFWRLLTPMMAKQLRKEVQAELTTLKLLMESTRSAPATAL